MLCFGDSFSFGASGRGKGIYWTREGIWAYSETSEQKRRLKHCGIESEQSTLIKKDSSMLF